MTRKLKRKIKKSSLSSSSSINSDSIQDSIQTKPKRKIKRYKKQKCAFVYECGERCKNNAVGKSTLCKQHGGSPVIKENLVPAELEPIVKGLVSKYDPMTHPVLFMDYSRMGMSDVEIAAEFKVSVETLRGWAEKYEMFNKAYDIGQAMHETWWLEQGKAGLENRGFNTTLYKYLTSNKLGYSDKMETKNMNMNVHGVLMVPDQMSEDEWEKENEDIIDVDS